MYVRNSSFRTRDVAAQKKDDQAYVRNSSFLSRDIEAQKAKEISNSPVRYPSPPKDESKNSNAMKCVSPPMEVISLTKKIESNKILSPPKTNSAGLPIKKDITSPPKKDVPSPPIRNLSRISSFQKQNSSFDSSKGSNSPSAVGSPVLNKNGSPPSKPITTPIPQNKGVISPPINSFKCNKTESKSEDAKEKKGPIVTKEIPVKTEKLSLPANAVTNNVETNTIEKEKGDKEIEKGEESNGVGDKIRKFEKAAEDASASSGRLSRPGSVRGRSRTERLGSDSKEDLPPPATPFKDHVFFDQGNSEISEPNQKSVPLERQNSLNKTSNVASKWQRNESSSIEEKVQKPEPQKIIKPEFKPMSSPVDLTIRSPSLGTKLPDQFPSQGTAFRNVASPDSARSNTHKFNEDNSLNNIKVCKLKNKEKYSVSKGSSYFTRGSEEIWLVKKKDIEEIEERVLDSFRRAGGNICMRSESMRPSSDSGQSVSFPHATMGRNKRPMYTRSESLDPQWAGTRAQTLKRQSSIACTCGHDKKTRSKSAASDATPRLRSRSHGDENNQGHVLDKYETLV